MATKIRTSPGGLAQLGEQRRRVRLDALENWRKLAARAASGEELDGLACEELGDACEALGIEDVEGEFNSDVSALQSVGRMWKELNTIRGEGLPARLTAIADEVRTLKERIRQLETERNEKRIRLESCGALLRELEAAKSANRRVFPEGGE